MSDDTKKYTAAYKLFHKYYRCLVPGYVLGEYESNKYGYRRAGDTSDDDNHLASREVPIRATVLVDGKRATTPSIAEMVSNGVSVTLMNPEDSKDIYFTIRDHLTLWRDWIDNSYVLPGTADEQEEVLHDLVKLDKLQLFIYKVASRYLGDDRGSLLSSRLSTSRLTNNLRRKKSEITNNQGKTYTPLSMDLKKGYLQRRKRGLG